MKETIGYKVDALAQFAKSAANAHYVELGNIATVEYEPTVKRYLLTTGGSTYSLDNNDIRDNGVFQRLEKDIALRAEYLDAAKKYGRGEMPPYDDIAKDILDKNDDAYSFKDEMARRLEEYNKEIAYEDEAVKKPVKILEIKPEVKSAESINW